MLTSEGLSTRLFVAENKKIFEDVAKDYKISSRYRIAKYTILDYRKILDELCAFVRGYYDYKQKNDDKYKNKVFESTRAFYNKMFTDDDKYRKEISLPQMKDINKGFLEGTKKLQDLLEEYIPKSKDDIEFHRVLIMTDNQYRKISKVYRDDMEIYLWLATDGSTVYEHHIPAKLRADYLDTSTPVMHPKKIDAAVRKSLGDD